MPLALARVEDRPRNEEERIIFTNDVIESIAIMKKTQISSHEFPNDNQDKFIEVHFTPKEDKQIRDLARRDKISVAELLRREALKDTNNIILENNYLHAVIDATDKIREIHKAAIANGALPTIEIGTALLKMADEMEQLTKFYECRVIEEGSL